MGETQGLKTVTGATVSEITDHSVSYTDKSGNTVTIPARSVISAFGYRAYDPLQQIAEKHCSEVYTVGCAVKAGNALTATREGYEAGLKI
jgi:NADH dehydrogenase FAD-containing subunit